MEGMKELRHVVPKGWWMILIDLQDYYLHFRLKDGEEQRLRFHFDGSWWVYTAAVFGFGFSAYVASRTSQEIVRALRRKFGLKGMVWVDDFLFAFRTEEEARNILEYLRTKN